MTAAGRLDGEPLTLEPGGGLLGCDVAFPALHGPYGEDGTVQGLLEALASHTWARGCWPLRCAWTRCCSRS